MIYEYIWYHITYLGICCHHGMLRAGASQQVAVAQHGPGPVLGLGGGVGDVSGGDPTQLRGLGSLGDGGWLGIERCLGAGNKTSDVMQKLGEHMGIFSKRKTLGTFQRLNFHEEMSDHWASIIVVSEGEDVWKLGTAFFLSSNEEQPIKAMSSRACTLWSTFTKSYWNGHWNSGFTH